MKRELWYRLNVGIIQLQDIGMGTEKKKVDRCISILIVMAATLKHVGTGARKDLGMLWNDVVS